MANSTQEKGGNPNQGYQPGQMDPDQPGQKRGEYQDPNDSRQQQNPNRGDGEPERFDKDKNKKDRQTR